MLRIRLLGDQNISVDDLSLNQPLGRRSLELVAYLVAHAGSPQPRQHLAGVFWPDSTDSQALTNLRREVHRVRSVFGSADCGLEVDARTLTWRANPGVECDVTEFVGRTDQARAARAENDSPRFRHAAAQAVSLYRGDFMPGSYEDWIETQRDRLHRVCVGLLDDLIASCRSHDVGSALRWSTRRLDLEPLEETGYQTLMQIQVAAGDRAAAIRTYHRCVSVLDRELGVRPGPATTQRYREISTASRSGAAQTAGSLPDRSVRPMLVGRELECQELRVRWERVAGGSSGLHLVSGEAGVGKSRLIDEFVSSQERAGTTVAWARCFAGSGQSALAPVAQWLDAPGVRARYERLDPRWRREVERLLPSPDAKPAASPHNPMVDAWQRPQFIEGLTNALADPREPTLLVVEDLHWCDGETANWLPHFLTSSRGSPLLVLATTRPEDVEDHPGVVAMIRQLRTAGLVSETMLTPLPTRHTASLAGNVLGSPLTDQEAEEWQQATGGFPLFVVEVARARQDAMPDQEVAGQPQRVHAVLEHRLGQLSTKAQHVASLASCVGRDFSLDVLSEASDLKSDAVLDAVDELWRRRIFRSRSAQTYDFSHDLLRDAAYEQIDDELRALYHRRIAQAMELLHSDDIRPVAAALAEQYGRAKQPQRAIRYHLVAASQAAKVFANLDAIRHHDRGIELLALIPAGHDRDRLELTLRHAVSAPLNAQFGYASDRMRTELDRSVELSDRLDDKRLRLLSLTGLFAVRYVQGDVAESFRIAERSLELSEHCPEVAGQAHFAYAGAATSLGLHEDSLPHFAAAHELSIDHPPSLVGTRPEVHGRAWCAHALWLLGRTDDSTKWSKWAIDRAEDAGHPYSLAVALAYAAITEQLKQDLDGAGEMAQRTQEICARYDFAYYREWGTVIEGWCLGGHVGVDLINRGLQSLRSQGALARQPYFLGLLADTLLVTGDTDRAAVTLDAALVAANDHADRWWLAELWRLKSLTCSGEPARQMITKALEVADEQGSVALRDRVLTGTARP